MAVVLTVEVPDQKMLEVVEREQAEHDLEEQKDALGEAAQIPDQVQVAVHVPVDPVEGQIEFKYDGHVHQVSVLVWPANASLVAKNGFFILRDLTELVKLILQLQLRQLHLVDNLLSHLGVHRDIVQFGLAGHFILGSILARIKPHLVVVDDNELPAQPFIDFQMTGISTQGNRSVHFTFGEQFKRLAVFQGCL